MPLPCIVQVKKEGNPLFSILSKITDDEVYYYPKDKLHKSPKENFFNAWTGVCLLIKTTQKSKEPEIEKKLRIERVFNVLKISVITLLLFWCISTFYNSGVITNNLSLITCLCLIGLKLTGLFIGLMLLWFEIDEYNPTLQSFCSGKVGGKTNCSAVLNSKYAKLFSTSINFSILSFSYFFSTFLFVFVSGFSKPSLSLISVFSFLTIPIVFLSIYFQAIMIKQWCKFCIIIQGVLIVEIIVSLISGFYKKSFPIESLSLLFALFLIPIIVWNLFKPLLIVQKEANLNKRLLKKLKNNQLVFDILLKNSKKIKTNTAGLGISITSEKAIYNITKVCNPYCEPCSKAHAVLNDLFKTGKINLQLIYSAKDDFEDPRAKPVSYFLDIDSKGDKKKTLQVLDDWYLADKKDFSIFAKEHSIKNELYEKNPKINEMNRWCSLENITHTPTIFINGSELPKEYSILDLKEML